ncbi:MAG: FHA domain-containing protein [Acidobacteriota bacterium]|nr:FHA domain-containing protein [Acidobacteriota bacterium]
MTQPNTAASLAARLVGRSGDYQGNEFFIKGDDFAIGRAFECHLMLNDEMISARHARIVHTGDQYELQDLGSTNGTFVNGEKIDKKVLRTGDMIMFGGLTFEFVRPVDVSRTMVATPEAMAELAKAKAAAGPGAASAPAAGHAAASTQVVKIPKPHPAHGHVAVGLIPGLLMGLLIAYVLPLLAAAFQMNKAGSLTGADLLNTLRSWVVGFPGMYTHEGWKIFGLRTVPGIIVLVGLALGPIVGGFLVRRIGRCGAFAAALGFSLGYVVVSFVAQAAVLKFAFAGISTYYPGIVSTLGAWGNMAVVLVYFAGIAFILSFFGALLSRTHNYQTHT